MNLWTTTLAASCLLAGIVPQDPSGTASSGKLTRVAPAPQDARAFPSQGRRTREARREQDLDDWRARLTADDLDERERAYEELVTEAQGDPALQAALEEWSRDASDLDLAWSARLALRELRSPARLSPWSHRFGPGAIDGFGFDPRAWPDPQALLDQFHQRFERGFGVPQPAEPGASSSFESVSIQMDDDGVKCKVTKRVEGEEVTEEYTAKTMEELLEAHPELRDELKVEAFGPGALPFGGGFLDRFGFDRFGFDPYRPGLPAPRAGDVRTDVLGVYVAPLTPEESQALALEPGQGLRIERVEPGTIAAQLGLQRGHVLVEIDGHPIGTREDITARLSQRAPDGPLEIKVIDRWGQERKRVWKPDAGKQI